MNDDDLADRMTELARSFPCLRGAPGVSPWDPLEFDRWACGPASHGVQVTARCLLAVWDRSTDWEAEPFDVMEAPGNLALFAPQAVPPAGIRTVVAVMKSSTTGGQSPFRNTSGHFIQGESNGIRTGLWAETEGPGGPG